MDIKPTESLVTGPEQALLWHTKRLAEEAELKAGHIRMPPRPPLRLLRSAACKLWLPPDDLKNSLGSDQRMAVSISATSRSCTTVGGYVFGRRTLNF